MATVKLGGLRGGVALVDEADLPRVADFSWHVGNVGYVRGRADGQVQLLHRFILGTVPRGMVVDHAH